MKDNFKEPNRIVRSIFGFSINVWVNFFINLIVVVFQTRLFLPEDLGKINMFVTISTILVSVIPLGMGSAYLRFYSRDEFDRPREYLMIDGLLVSAFCCVFLSVLCFIFRNNVSYYIVGDNECDVLVLLFLYSFSSVFFSFLLFKYRLEGSYIYYNCLSILSTVVGKLLCSLVGFVCPNYRVYIYVMAIATFLLAIFYFIVQFRKINFSEYYVNMFLLKDMLRYGCGLFPGVLISIFSSAIGNNLVRNFLNFKSVGVYSVASYLTLLCAFVSVSFISFWEPFVFSGYCDEHKSKIIKDMLKYIVIVSLFLISIVALFQDIIFKLLGDEYIYAKYIVLFLFVVPVCDLISETVVMGVYISKKTYWITIIQIAGLATNFIVSLFGVKHWGLLGVAVGQAVSRIVMLILGSFIGNKYYKINKATYHIFISVLILILLCSLNYFLRFNIILRYLAVLLIILIEFLLYRKEVCYLVKMSISFINQTFKKKEGRTK